MSEPTLSKDITPQEDAVEEIEQRDFASVDELEAFTEGDDRKKVESAVEAKKAEIAEADEDADDTSPASDDAPVSESSSEQAPGDEKPEETADAEDSEADSDEEESGDTIQVAVVEVEKDSIAKLFEAVHKRVVYDKNLRGKREAEGVDAKLEKACDALEDLFNADGDPVEVEEQKLADIAAAIAQKVNKEQERRGMASSPSDMDRALIQANEALSELNQ